MKIEEFCNSYLENIETEFLERWEVIPVDLSQPNENEVIIGLLRRQYVLASRFALNPGIWNPDVAPIILRSMVEIYIWMAWILKEPKERATKYIEYGLGQEKLFIKHRKDEVEAMGLSCDEDPAIRASIDWINCQRYTDHIDVNLSSRWAGVNTREMAEECGCRDFYRFTYPGFSASVHSMWNHVSKFDLCCERNPLHCHHLVPFIDLFPIMTDMLYLAAKYLDKTFNLVDRSYNLSIESESTFETLFPCNEEE